MSGQAVPFSSSLQSCLRGGPDAALPAGVYLSRELDTTKSDAAVEDRLLKLRIPKAEAAKKRTIDIKVR